MLAIRALAIAGVVTGLVVLVARTDLASTCRALARVSPWPIALAAVINFGIIGCKAIAWRTLLQPEHDVPVMRLFRYTLASCAASIILPLRAGELVRLWMLRDRDGVPVARGVAVAVAEKLLDVLSMVIVVAPVPLLLAGVPTSVGVWITGLALGLVALLVGLRIWGPKPGVAGWRGQVGEGLAVLRDGRRFARATAALLVAWLIDLAMIELVLHAARIDLPLGSGALLLLAINAAIAIPTTPGQLGVLELGALLGLRLLHAPESESLVFAVTYHLLQVVPILLAALAVGAKDLWRYTPRNSA